MARLFKPGDRVRLKTGGPIMRVIRYEPETYPLLGSTVSNCKLRCVWYDKKMGRQEAVLHQRSLTKILTTHPELYTSNIGSRMIDA